MKRKSKRIITIIVVAITLVSILAVNILAMPNIYINSGANTIVDNYTYQDKYLNNFEIQILTEPWLQQQINGNYQWKRPTSTNPTTYNINGGINLTDAMWRRLYINNESIIYDNEISNGAITGSYETKRIGLSQNAKYLRINSTLESALTVTSEINIKLKDVIIKRDNYRETNTYPYDRLLNSELPAIMFEYPLNETHPLQEAINWLTNHIEISAIAETYSQRTYKGETTTDGEPGKWDTITENYYTEVYNSEFTINPLNSFHYSTIDIEGIRYFILYIVPKISLYDDVPYIQKFSGTNDVEKNGASILKFKEINFKLNVNENEVVPNYIATSILDQFQLKTAIYNQDIINNIENEYKEFILNSLDKKETYTTTTNTYTEEVINFGDKISDFFVNTLGGIFEFEIAPHISVGSILSVMIIFAIFIIILKIFAGG